VRDVAGDAPALGPAATVKFEREQHEGKFRLSVCPHGRVRPFALKIVPADPAAAGREAGHGRHPRATGAQHWHQVRHQRDVAEVVGRELQLVAVGADVPGWWCHHCGIVYQQVDRPSLGPQPATQRRDRGKGREVERAGRDDDAASGCSDPGERGLALGRVAYGQDDLCPSLGEALGQPEADAVAGTGDQRERAGEVGDGQILDRSWHGPIIAAPPGRMKARPIPGSALPGSPTRD
jgi:hypothetical protein